METIDTPTYRPKLKVLNKEQAWRIHYAALDILEKTGFKMEHPEIVELLSDAGCRVEKDDWMTMPAYLVEEAIQSAPKSFDLYDQLGNPSMSLSGDNFYYGTGSDTFFTLDLETHERRKAEIEDVGRFAKMVDALPNMHFAMSMGNPVDVPIEDIYLHEFAMMMRECNKPLCFIADSGKDIAKMYDLAVLAAGSEEEFQKKPFMLNYSEAISPLRYPKNVMEKLLFCAEKRIPICLPSGCNAGSGGPITLAGSLAQGIAENLVGLVIHQLTNRGAPFLFGPNVSILDMRHTVVSYGCIEWSLTQAALADLRDEVYRIPIWAFGGSTDSKSIDAQAGAEGMFSIVTSMLSRCNFIHDVGYIESGSTSSLEMVVLSDEMIEMSKAFTQGIEVNDTTLALDVIERVGRGPDGAIYLSDPHTAENFREAHMLPEVMDRARYNVWEKEGKPAMFERCNEKAKKLLSEHEVKPKSPETMKAIDTILDNQVPN